MMKDIQIQSLKDFSFDPLNPRISSFYKQLNLAATLLIDIIAQTAPFCRCFISIGWFKCCHQSDWSEQEILDQ